MKDASERYFTNYYTTYVKYDPKTNEYYLELPSTALFHLGWNDQEEVEFNVIDDGNKRLIIKKKENNNE